MRVLKRSGSFEDVSFDKILTRIQGLSSGGGLAPLQIDETLVAQKVVQEIYDGVETSQLDELSSQIAIAMYSQDPDFKTLAGRIVVSNHHKNTLDTFTEKIELLYRYAPGGVKKPLIADYFYELVQEHSAAIEEAIDYQKDYLYDFFGFKTLERNYLYQIDKVIVERPQDMLMRVSLAIHRHNIDDALENYRMMADHHFTHATPTLFNAGSQREQFASCFLLTMKEDSVHGIYDTLKDCALISKHAGGIGLSVHDIRASDSYIAGTNGYSNGLVPMLRVFNDTARYIDQGGNKRNGSFAIYLEPWHADVFAFLELKKNHGNELERARDLFYALWIPDLFMKRVKADGLWSLMCPHECPGLSDCHSEAFETLYESYETKEMYRKQVKARSIWQAILTSQIETGTPYLLYKDACNRKSNQQNLGTIKSSNLCTEIVEFTSKDETAVCNLASISLKKYVRVPSPVLGQSYLIYSKEGCPDCESSKALLNKYKIKYVEITIHDFKARQRLYRQIDEDEDLLVDTMPQIYSIPDGNSGGRQYLGGYGDLKALLRPTYDFKGLEATAAHLVTNLNHIIDHNYYPIPETRKSNLMHRPIGIGVQGLANVFLEMGYPFDSEEARTLNKDIFETIYYGSMKRSMELSKVHGPYSSYEGSPLSEGKFQFDLWSDGHKKLSGRYELEWDILRSQVMEHGCRNSLLVAPMPTASTAQILGNYECFEPIMSNVYTRRVLAGEYMVMNDYLMRDLQDLGLWSKEIKDEIVKHDGSVQSLRIPQNLKDLYKTVWELKQKVVLDMAVDRGHFICQSQSLNLFLESPDIATLTSMHFYGWEQGLKTGLYYLRSRPSSKAIQFSLDAEAKTNPEENTTGVGAPAHGPCESCSG